MRDLRRSTDCEREGGHRRSPTWLAVLASERPSSAQRHSCGSEPRDDRDSSHEARAPRWSSQRRTFEAHLPERASGGRPTLSEHPAVIGCLEVKKCPSRVVIASIMAEQHLPGGRRTSPRRPQVPAVLGSSSRSSLKILLFERLRGEAGCFAGRNLHSQNGQQAKHRARKTLSPPRLARELTEGHHAGGASSPPPGRSVVHKTT
jgi:hypothetical protein